MKGQIFAVFYTLINYMAYCQENTPLCETCACTSLAQKVFVNCISVNIPNIYSQQFWFDQFNNSYQIDSLVWQYNDLKILKTNFPPSRLTVLDLSHNSIKNVTIGIFSQLQEMAELSLSYNDIEYLHPDVFKGVYEKSHYYPLRSLKKLDLQHNKLYKLHPDIFEHIDEILELNLSHNPFKVLDYQVLQAIASLVYLATLDLSYTQIKTLPIYFLYTPRHLTNLDLSGNELETIPEALQYTRSLKVLYFNQNPLRNISKVNYFPTVSTLTTLHLSHMPYLEMIGPKAFAGLRNLNELELSYNVHLSIIHPDAFIIDENLQNNYVPIRKLLLNNNNLTILEKALLPNWEELEELNLHGNPWSCDCKNQWLVTEVKPLFDEAKLDLNLQCGTQPALKYKSLVALNQYSSCETAKSKWWAWIVLTFGSLLAIVIYIVCKIKDRITKCVTNKPRFETVPMTD